MWRFISNILSSTIGTLIALFLFIIIITGIMVSSNIETNQGEVLKIDLFNPIVEHAAVSPLDDLDLPIPVSTNKDGLIEIIQSINHAKNDNNIKAILVRCSSIQAGYATVKEIRDALNQFKESGKPVYFHSNSLAENAFYLSTVGESYVSPTGMIEFNGLQSEVMFFKNLLSNLDVESKIYRVGKYKSAIEPFLKEKMSPESRNQLIALQEELYTSILEDIAESKNTSAINLREISDNMYIRSVQDAVSNKLINGAKYEDEVITLINQTISPENTDKIKFVDWKNYHQQITPEAKTNKIAVIIAQGEIMPGKDNGDGETIGSTTLIKQIRKAKKDENIKAVVLRINSPGGSALASDIIWREIELLKKKKPVIASMSDVAASGGYYIAMGCNKVIASPNTITGSIGVFGIMFNIENFMNNKLGITFDRVETGKFSGIPSFTRQMSLEEDSIIQNEVERIYYDFIEKAAEGRNTTSDEVHKVAQGRVWNAKDALKVNLIDTLGGLQDAIKIAAEEGKLDQYQLEILPKETGFWSKLSSDSKSQTNTILNNELGKTYSKVKRIKNLQGYQMHNPFWLEIK